MGILFGVWSFLGGMAIGFLIGVIALVRFLSKNHLVVSTKQEVVK